MSKVLSAGTIVVEARSEASFGTRVLLGGEQVYVDANPTLQRRQVELVVHNRVPAPVIVEPPAVGD